MFQPCSSNFNDAEWRPCNGTKKCKYCSSNFKKASLYSSGFGGKGSFGAAVDGFNGDADDEMDVDEGRAT